VCSGLEKVPAASIVAYIAEQIGLDHNLMRDYAHCEKTRREHLVELENILGYRTSRRKTTAA